jgi:hypothetical protein
MSTFWSPQLDRAAQHRDRVVAGRRGAFGELHGAVADPPDLLIAEPPVLFGHRLLP